MKYATAIEVLGGIRPAQLLIQGATFRIYSHARILTNYGTVIDSRASEGVTEHPKSYHGYRWWWKHTLNCDHDTRVKIYKIAKAQEGTKYDFGWLVGWPITRRWQDDDAWVCSELVAASLVESGYIDEPHRIHRITPGDIRDILTR